MNEFRTQTCLRRSLSAAWSAWGSAGARSVVSPCLHAVSQVRAVIVHDGTRLA